MSDAMSGKNVRWGRLVLGCILAGALGLSTHLVLQQVLGVSYPDMHLVPAWAKFLNNWGTWAAVCALWILSKNAYPARSWYKNWLLISLAYMLCKETFRAAVMEGVVTTAYALHLVMALPDIAAVLGLCAIAGLLMRFAPGMIWITLGGLVVALVAKFLWSPYVTALLTHAVASLGLADHDEIYPPPYDYHVLIPAYLTYIEPVIGTVIFSWLTGARRSFAMTVGINIVIYLFLCGHAEPSIFWSAFGPLPLWQSFLSYFQFALEHLVLVAVITSACWFSAMFPRPIQGASTLV